MTEDPKPVHDENEAAPAVQHAPAAEPAPPSRPKRPGAPFGIGLTLIICGSLASLFGVFGGLFTMTASSMMTGMAMLGTMGGDPAAKQAFDAVMAESKSIYVVQGALQVVMGLVSVLALIAGIGLVKYRLWGRKSSLAWAGLALAYIAVSLVVNLVYVVPASEKMMQALMGMIPGGATPFASGMMSGITGVSQVFGSLLLAVLPVLTLVLISKDKVKNCLT